MFRNCHLSIFTGEKARERDRHFTPVWMDPQHKIIITMGNRDREAFLRRLEGGKQDPADTLVIANDATLKLLKDVGLEGTPIDPISLKALEGIVIAQKTAAVDTVPELKPEPAVLNQEPIEVKQEEIAFEDITSEIKEIKESITSMCVTTTENTEDSSKPRSLPIPAAAAPVTIPTKIPASYMTARSPAPNSAPTDTSTEHQIMDQLALQTQMIVDVHKRLDDLTRLVHQIAQQQNGAPIPQQQQQQNRQLPPFSEALNVPPPPQVQAPPRYRAPQIHETGPPPPPPPPQRRVVAPEPVQAVHVARGAPQQQQPRGMMFGQLVEYLESIPKFIGRSKFWQVCRAFWTLHQRHVRIEGGMIFKVLLMVAIFSAKTMSRKKTSKGYWSPSMKFYLVMSLVATGFLIQAGYFKLFYEFFFKGDYIGRIYRGDDAVAGENDNNNEGAAGQQQQPQAAAPVRNNNNDGDALNNLRNWMPQQNILGGEIPRVPEGQINNPIMDVAILIGSFLLSILPMWNPQGAPNHRRVVVAEPGQLNEVAPPRDIDEHAADSDSDDDSDSDEEEEMAN